jgi:hypothetical protein
MIKKAVVLMRRALSMFASRMAMLTGRFLAWTGRDDLQARRGSTSECARPANRSARCWPAGLLLIV